MENKNKFGFSFLFQTLPYKQTCLALHVNPERSVHAPPLRDLSSETEKGENVNGIGERESI